MKSIYFAIGFIIFFEGCSTVYNISDYSDKNSFIKIYNENSLNNEIEVRLINDSVISLAKGSFIREDTLFSLAEIRIPGIMSVNEIKNITYERDNKSATLSLNNGLRINAINPEFTKDSVKFDQIDKKITIASPTKNIESATYKNHLIGTVPAFIVGGLFSYSLGVLIKSRIASKDDEGLSSFVDVGGILILGEIVSIVTGYFIGHNYIFQFNR